MSIDQVISDYSLRIGAFYIDDNNQLKCGGISDINGNSPFSIALYGDDSLTPEKDGFSSGDTIHWISLDMQANIVMNGIIALTTGSNLWSSNTINVVSNLDFTPPIYGCTDQAACNYNPEANMADGSCEYAEQGYDCEGNITVQVGDEAFGGIVFYIDETGQHGLVAALNDIGSFDWILNNAYSIDGTEGLFIGDGMQNTINLYNEIGDLGVAAQMALDFQTDSYDDWYLPSRDELIQLCVSDINLSSEKYWSSSESSSYEALAVDFNYCSSLGSYKGNSHRVIPIRSF